MELEDVKKRYAEYERKHRLPSFSSINEAFEIDKIEKDSDAFLRVVRKAMMEKIVNSMSFVEMLLNPVSAPRMYFSYIKNMTLQDKEAIEKMYDVLSDLSVNSLALEIDTSEKAEADLIRQTFEKWESIKPLFRKVVENIKKPIGNENRKEKSYFG